MVIIIRISAKLRRVLIHGVLVSVRGLICHGVSHAMGKMTPLTDLHRCNLFANVWDVLPRRTYHGFT